MSPNERSAVADDETYLRSCGWRSKERCVTSSRTEADWSRDGLTWTSFDNALKTQRDSDASVRTRTVTLDDDQFDRLMTVLERIADKLGC